MNEDEYKDYDRPKLLELVMYLKAQIDELLEKNAELKEKLESYRNMRDIEIKKIVYEKSSKKRESEDD